VKSDDEIRKTEGYCEGTCTSAYRKGQLCCGKGKFRTDDGRVWCKNHLPINQQAVAIPKKAKE
jgi:hypothetical protein